MLCTKPGTGVVKNFAVIKSVSIKSFHCTIGFVTDNILCLIIIPI